MAAGQALRQAHARVTFPDAGPGDELPLRYLDGGCQACSVLLGTASSCSVSGAEAISDEDAPVEQPGARDEVGRA
jgi:hypothetical protein